MAERSGKAKQPAVIEGGTRPRRRAPDRRSWTARKESNFFAALADSCNVKLAAGIAGVSTSAIYVRRERDASFRAGWERALAEGYAKLELEMLKRALHGVEKRIVRDGETMTVREFNDRIALALLRLHRETAAIADEGVSESDYEEARERIVERLARLREQEPREAGDEAGTKGSADSSGLAGRGSTQRR